MNLRNYAYLGDAVWELHIRQKTVVATNNAKKLHELTTARVKGSFQAYLLNELENILTEEEKDIVTIQKSNKYHKKLKPYYQSKKLSKLYPDCKLEKTNKEKHPIFRVFCRERIEPSEKIRPHLRIIVEQQIAVRGILSGNLQSHVVSTGKAIVPIQRHQLRIKAFVSIKPCSDTL